MSKRDFGTIKSLLHFDFPYFNEPGDGLGDEVGLETWSGNSNVLLAGNEIPKAATATPKFGYRCAYLNNVAGRITGTNTTGIFNLSPLGSYEAECFVSMGAVGTIFTFGDLILAINSSKQLVLTCTAWGLNETSETTLGSTWQHILLRLSDGTASVWLDGVQIISASISGDEITPETVQLGGFVGYMDEFVFRHSAGNGAPTVPTQPYNAKLNLSKIGGFGTGVDGDVVIEENSTINTRYYMGRIYSNNRFILYDSSWEELSGLNVGDEIMILLYRGGISHIGQYVFRKIKSIDGTVVTINKNISEANGDDFNLEDIQEEYYEEADGETYYSLLYTVYVIKIPNYNTLTINADVTINPVSGIVAFRCRGDCTVNGYIITLGTGSIRSDLYQMRHGRLIDRFLYAQGGGIFIVCGGTFTAPSTARLGASWPGIGETSSTSSLGGAAGYGGNKFADTSLSYGGVGAGVGGNGGGVNASSVTYGSLGNGSSRNSGAGAGGGGCGYNGGAGSTYSNTGKTCHSSGSGGGGQGGSGGKAAEIVGESPLSLNSSSRYTFYKGNDGTINGGDSKLGTYVWNGGVTCYIASGSGGGGPGGSSGSSYNVYYTNGNGRSYSYLSPSSSGACLILICKRLDVHKNVISTGGAGSKNTPYRGSGGTGFCYIACEEMI